MIRKQDIFPQKTECENPKHAKNRIENLFKGSQIKGLNKDYDRYYRRTNPPTFLVEKKHTRKQSIQGSMQRGPKKKTKQEREKDHKLLVKKKRKRKKRCLYYAAFLTIQPPHPPPHKHVTRTKTIIAVVYTLIRFYCSGFYTRLRVDITGQGVSRGCLARWHTTKVY